MFVSLGVVLPAAVPVTGRLSCCNPEPSAALVVRIELLAFIFWSIRADFADSNGETGIVVIVVFKLLSSLVFCGCWSCAGLGVGLHGWGCEAVLVTEGKEFSTAWCCVRADEPTIGIKLDFLNVGCGSTVMVGEMVSAVRLGRLTKWLASSRSPTGWSFEDVWPFFSSSGTVC